MMYVVSVLVAMYAVVGILKWPGAMAHGFKLAVPHFPVSAEILAVVIWVTTPLWFGIAVVHILTLFPRGSRFMEWLGRRLGA